MFQGPHWQWSEGLHIGQGFNSILAEMCYSWHKSGVIYAVARKEESMILD